MTVFFFFTVSHKGSISRICAGSGHFDTVEERFDYLPEIISFSTRRLGEPTLPPPGKPKRRSLPAAITEFISERKLPAQVIWSTERMTLPCSTSSPFAINEKSPLTGSSPL